MPIRQGSSLSKKGITWRRRSAILGWPPLGDSERQIALSGLEIGLVWARASAGWHGTQRAPRNSGGCARGAQFWKGESLRRTAAVASGEREAVVSWLVVCASPERPSSRCRPDILRLRHMRDDLR